MAITAAFLHNTIPEASCHGADHAFTDFFIDSRMPRQGGTFIALSGHTHDGHDYVADAVKKGASAVIVQNNKQECLNAIPQSYRNNIAIAVVPDTYQALFDMASAWRQQFTCPVVGVTGSVGKTSTKELLARVLHNAGKNCFVSHGNQNTQIGVALNMLELRADHEVAVFEVGIEKRGEMERRVHLLQPTTGVITSVAHSHLAGLGSLNDIAAQKRLLFSRFNSDNIGIINGDIPILSSISYPHPVIRFGFKTTNQVQARKVQIHGNTAHFILKLYGRRYQITAQTGHMGHISNMLACAATCCFLGISDKDIVSGLQQPVYVPGRYHAQTVHHGNSIVIDDCYNANPASMKEALIAFERLETSSEKIAVLGDMDGLGVSTAYWHRQLGRILRKAPSITRVILVGRYVHWAQETVPFGVNVHVVANWKEAYDFIKDHSLADHSAMLVKASRSVGLDNLVNAVTHVSVSR